MSVFDNRHIPGIPEPVEYLVYICGVQMPATLVTVLHSVGQPSTATVLLPPDPELRGLGRDDLVPLEIFYLDVHGRARYGLAPEWCVLFEGFIVRSNYQNSGESRNFSLTAVDKSITLQMLKVFWLANVSNLIQDAADGSGARVGSPQAEYVFPASLFYYGLDPAGGQPIRRPYDFIDNIFRTLVGNSDVVGPIERAINANPSWISQGARPLVSAVSAAAGGAGARQRSVMALHWWGRLARRTAFMERWLPMPGIEDTNKLMQDGAFPVLKAVRGETAITAVRRLAASLGDGASLWDLLTEVYSRMVYEVLTVPSPPAVRVSRGERQVLGPPGSGGDMALAQYVTKPVAPFAAVPACNVIWPSMCTGLTVDEDYLSQPTRALYADGNVFNIMGLTSDTALQDYYNFTTATAYPPAFQERLDKHLGRNGNTPDPASNIHNLVIYPDEFYRGPIVLKGQIPAWFVFLHNADSSQMGGTSIDLATQFRTEAVAHIDQQIATASPAAATRLRELRTQIDTLAVSPDDAAAGTTATQVADGWDRAAQYLGADHPEIEYKAMPRALTFQTEYRSQTSSSAAEREVRALYVAQEFLLTKYRARNAGVSCVFHPYVVPGLPGMFFDKQASGHHVQGKVMNVTHQLSPNGASTSLNSSMVRTMAELTSDLIETRRDLISAPDDPVEIVREVFQTQLRAEAAYAKLLYQKRTDPVVFNPDTELRARARDLDGRLGNYVDIRALPQAALSGEQVLFEPNPDRVGTPAFDLERARRDTARPVCTLPEWIKLHEGYGVAREGDLVPARVEGRKDSYSCRYWIRILQVTPGPGREPKAAPQGNLLGTTGADTRRDWQARLLRVRYRYYNLEPGRLA